MDHGDLAKPDQGARRRASHYTTFLIMQALRVLGDVKVVPAMDPIQLEHTLKEADLLQIEWDAPYLPFGEDPATKTQNYKRVGGCTTKVIRWAFEAQGLHAPLGSGYDYNEIGVPRPVDIYIKSLRPTLDPGFQSSVDFGFGSYVPVSLHWHQLDNKAPAWQADPNGGIVWRQADQEIDVWVGNRGTSTATDVTVSVWFAVWPAAQDEPPANRHRSASGLLISIQIPLFATSSWRSPILDSWPQRAVSVETPVYVTFIYNMLDLGCLAVPPDLDHDSSRFPSHRVFDPDCRLRLYRQWFQSEHFR